MPKTCTVCFVLSKQVVYLSLVCVLTSKICMAVYHLSFGSVLCIAQLELKPPMTTQRGQSVYSAWSVVTEILSE